MMIADVIRHTDSELEIYSLVNAYLEAIQIGDKTTFISQATTALPLTDKTDLQKRFDQLFLDLDNASKSLDDHACMAMKEALHVFGNALQQLRQIELLDGAQNNPPFAHHRDQEKTNQGQIMQTHLDQTHRRMEPQTGNQKPPVTH